MQFKLRNKYRFESDIYFFKKGNFLFFINLHAHHRVCGALVWSCDKTTACKYKAGFSSFILHYIHFYY